MNIPDLNENQLHEVIAQSQSRLAEIKAGDEKLIRELAAKYGWTVTINKDKPVRKGAPSKFKGIRVPPLYKDPTTGKTWSGRGMAPKWLKDEDGVLREELRIQEEGSKPDNFDLAA